MQKFLNALSLPLLILFIAATSRAELVPGARYFSGKAKIHMSKPAQCFVEMIYSEDLNQITARAILALPHLSPHGAPISFAVGPYPATYIPGKKLYRYQDATTAAIVKDLVISTANQTTPIKLAVLYWHSAAAHHDPAFCEELAESTSVDQLEDAEAAFSSFDEIQAQNP